MYNFPFDLNHIIFLLISFVIYKSLKIIKINLEHLSINSAVKKRIHDDAKNGDLHGEGDITPKSVNYHFTRKCNYECGFCFHTAKTSYMLNLTDAKKGLEMLEDAGNKKIYPNLDICRKLFSIITFKIMQIVKAC